MNVVDSLTANPSFRAAAEQVPDPAEFRRLFEQTVDELSLHYRAGTLSHVQEHHPDLHERTQRSQVAISAAWRALDLGGFKDAIEEYERCIEAQIEAFNLRKDKDE